MVLAPEIERIVQGTNWSLMRELCIEEPKRRALGSKRRVREVMLEGVAGSGKSFTWGLIFLRLGEMYPGIRILVTRKTRESLTDAFMKTWEDEVLLGSHPMLQGAARDNRHAYQFGNGTEMVCGGMDKASKLFSTSWDIWYCQEAFEYTEEEWIKGRRSMRNWGHPAMPFQLLCGDTNPDTEFHWIYQRMEAGKTERYSASHRDNPKHYDAKGKARTEEGDAYHDNLEALKLSDENPGVTYRRLARGEWCSASGAVWQNYDRKIHEVDRPEMPARLMIEPDDVYGRRCANALADHFKVRWWLGVMDWGHTDPGVFQVWGVTSATNPMERRMVRVVEVFRVGESIEWWATKALELHKEFGFSAIVCDPSRPDAINMFNDLLGYDREGPGRMARKANNAKTTIGAGDMSGLDLVRVGFQNLEDGKPAILFVRDSLRYGRDESLVSARRPWKTEMEIPSYTYVENDPEGKPRKEHTDPRCSDHGCDDTRMARTFVVNFDFSSAPVPRRLPPTSLGARFGDDKLVFDDLRRY